jgi:hypothetical protein
VFFDNFYLLNPVEGWAAVCISKNACSSLKAAVLTSLGRPVPSDITELHDLIGYDESELLRPVAAGPPPGMHVFGVWRDPVDRWYSAIAYLRQREEIRGRLRMLGVRNTARIQFSLEQALAVTAHQLQLEPIECDEHLRRQCDYCDFSTLDTVVELPHLDAFFERHNWAPPPRLNEGGKKLTRDDALSKRVQRLYEADYLLVPTA